MSIIDIEAMKASARAETSVVAYRWRRERMGEKRSGRSPTDLAWNKKSQGIARKRRSIGVQKTLDANVKMRGGVDGFRKSLAVEDGTVSIRPFTCL